MRGGGETIFMRLGGWRFLWLGGMDGGIFYVVVDKWAYFMLCVKLGGIRRKYVAGRLGGWTFYRCVGVGGSIFCVDGDKWGTEERVGIIWGKWG